MVDQLFKGWPGCSRAAGVTVFTGSGTLLGRPPGPVAGDDGATTEITGTDVVLAAGSVPRTIPGFDIDGTLVLTSDEVWTSRTCPTRWRSSAAGPSAASSPRC